MSASVKQYVDRTATVTRGVVNGAQSDRITFIAASLAYYAFISLLPLLLLALVAASFVGDPEMFEMLVVSVTEILGEQAGGLVEDALVEATGRSGATLFGLGFLLWSGLKLFRGLDVAFSVVYGDAGPDGLAVQMKNAAVALGAVAVGVTGTLLVGTAVTAAGLGRLLGTAEPGVLFEALLLVAGLTVAFLPLYYLLPGVPVTVREAIPGAVFAAVGWTLLQTGFRIYATHAGAYEAYGVLGAVLLLVIFLYFGALLLLLGGILNAVLADRVAPETDIADAETPDVRPTPTLDETMTRDRLDDDVSDAEIREELERLYDELDRFEERIDDRTVHREELEGDLRRYVRRRVRRGKARGWGPYLVLLYGTAMTLGAFWLLSGGWAILAMLVIWLSTLGLYVLMLLVGTTVTLTGLPGRVADRFGSR